MDFDQQLQTEHLLLEDRVCTVCNIKKGLLADFYRCRRDPSLTSSYSYECKQCTLERVRKKYKVGECVICGASDVKLIKDLCRSCDKGLKKFNHSIDNLKRAMVYLERE